MRPLRCEPRTVVITAASGGVGRASARLFAQRGDRLALVARGRAGLDAAVAQAHAVGAEAVAIVADVADPEAVERAAEVAERELGHRRRVHRLRVGPGGGDLSQVPALGHGESGAV